MTHIMGLWGMLGKLHGRSKTSSMSRMGRLPWGFVAMRGGAEGQVLGPARPELPASAKVGSTQPVSSACSDVGRKGKGRDGPGKLSANFENGVAFYVTGSMFRKSRGSYVC